MEWPRFDASKLITDGGRINAKTKEDKSGGYGLSTVTSEAMRVVGPIRYSIAITPEGYKIKCPAGRERFSGIATSDKPKLYIVSVDEVPVYIGITTQRMSARLRFGWRATGKNGYHGYRWRHHLTTANLDVWCHENAPDEKTELDMETVEAEIVFLIRSKGDWPKYQTEIHFHPSTPEHRRLADAIVSRYRLGVAGDASAEEVEDQENKELETREQSWKQILF